MANYVPKFFTHQMYRVPRTVSQFPSKLKFKARMSQDKFAVKNSVIGKLVVLPKIDELEELRKKSPYLDDELQGMTNMGQMRRLVKIADYVTELVRYERIEGGRATLQEARIYAELLIGLAIHNGDTHRPTMEMVDFYIREKDLVPKLFEVLVPRFDKSNDTNVKNPTSRFTDLYNLPPENLRMSRQQHKARLNLRGILELRGHPWPAVVPKERDQSGLITNVLLKAAKREREEAARQRAVESVKVKVSRVTKSLEAPPSPRTEVAAMTAVEDPYLNYRPVSSDSDVVQIDNSFEDDDVDVDVDDDDDDDDDEIELQLKNIDLNVTSH